MFGTLRACSRSSLPVLSSLDRGRRAFIGMIALLAMVVLASGPLRAIAADNPSGLPLPRFAATRSAPVNVRVGPGVRYDVAWVYVKPGVPVEIVQEFDVWRKIRDVDGSEGWVHQNLLTGKRAGFVAPWRAGEKIPLLARADEAAAVRAFLTAKFPVEIKDCDGTWCEVTATDHANPSHPATYSGFLRQSDLWGVYKDEKFD